MLEFIANNPQLVTAFSVFMAIMSCLLVILGVCALVKYLASPMR